MKTLARSAPAFLCAVIVFFLSSQQQLPQSVFLFPGIDKVFHAAEYGLLALSVYFALPSHWSKRAVISILLTSLYAVSDEVHQMFVPGRSSDVFDWLADTLGATTTVCLYTTARRMWRRRRAIDENAPAPPPSSVCTRSITG